MLYESYLILGAKGMVGRAVERKLYTKIRHNIFCADKEDGDLRNPVNTMKIFNKYRPDVVIFAAAHTGGRRAYTNFGAQFIYDNLVMEANIIHAAFLAKVKKLIFLANSGVYPKHAQQPIKEEYLLTGELEKTNEPFAIAKIAGIKLCENYYRQYHCNFISVVPANIYGPYDNFDLNSSHVLPALIRKFHESKISNFPSVTVWGTGQTMREFIHVDDLAGFILFAVQNIDAKDLYETGISHINIGTGEEIEVSHLAEMIKELVGYTGSINYDTGMAGGTPRKLLDISRVHKLGWYHKTKLKDGVQKTYQWYLQNLNTDIIQSTEKIDMGDTIEKNPERKNKQDWNFTE